jgi:hypothetical protein
MLAEANDAEVAALIGVGGGEQQSARLLGVKALMLAVLEDAIRAYLGPVPRSKEEAALWIADSRSRWVFSFPVVCETLGLEPGAVRSAVRRMEGRCAVAPSLGIGRSRPNSRRQAGLGIAIP